MGISVLNENFEQLYYIDTYTSLIWSIRYDEPGDFELYTSATSNIVNKLKEGYYVANTYGALEAGQGNKYEDRRLMIVEGVKTKRSVEAGQNMIFYGRSLESILDRRIVWGQRILYGNIQACVKALVMENVISPSVSARAIPNFIFEDTDDPVILSKHIDTQYTGDNLLDAIMELCSSCEVGFKVTLNENNKFVFKLYRGEDHSFSEDREQYVKFSPTFDNLFSSEYFENRKTFKNYTLIGGEGEGQERRYAGLGTTDTGLARREIFTDARDISSNVQEGEPAITNDQYNEMLYQRGQEKLYENGVTRTFDGKIDPERSFELNKDYFLGDVVQLSDDMGHDVAARIFELIYSEDESGTAFYPTFTVLDETLSSGEGTAGEPQSISGSGTTWLRPADIWAITYPEIDEIVV